MKLRLKGAQKGHSLLKKKADALTLRFRQILSKIVEVIGAAILSALHSPIPSAQNRVHQVLGLVSLLTTTSACLISFLEQVAHGRDNEGSWLLPG